MLNFWLYSPTTMCITLGNLLLLFLVVGTGRGNTAVIRVNSPTCIPEFNHWQNSSFGPIESRYGGILPGNFRISEKLIVSSSQTIKIRKSSIMCFCPYNNVSCQGCQCQLTYYSDANVRSQNAIFKKCTWIQPN